MKMDSTSIKALRALEWICLHDGSIGVTELADAIGVGKSNAHRILATLKSRNYVKNVEDGRYEATLKTWELGSAVIGRIDFKEIARPEMEDLSNDTLETVHLSIIDELDVIYIDKVESNQPVRAYSRIGGRAPAYTVATGKALLAFQSNIEQLIPPKLERYTAATIVERKKLIAELQKIRNDGYAINKGEWRDGICGVAAPIKNERGQIIAAIGVSGPGGRLTLNKLKEFSENVITSANRISRQMGFL